MRHTPTDPPELPIAGGRDDGPPPLGERLRREWFPVLVALLSLATALYFYPRLPAEVPTHWGTSGTPDDFSSRGWAAFFPVFLIVVLTVIFATLPSIEPRRGGVISAWRAYRWTRGAILSFLWWVQLLALSAALRPDQQLEVGLLLGGIGLLLFVLGIALTELRSNFFIGFRTPWTLSSEEVWRKTHRLARWLLVGGGALILLLSLLLPGQAMFTALLIILGVITLVPTVYSYVVWRQEQ